MIVVFTLLAFLTMKAFVPPGFMPSDGTTSSFYMLCHGDPGSAQLIALTESSENLSMPHAHHHSAHTQEHHANNSYHESARHNAEQPFCVYAAILGMVIAISLNFLGVFYKKHVVKFLDAVHFIQDIIAYFLPAVRAPPALLSSL